MSRKKPVSSSHLSLRFYKDAGWTKEILDKYLTRGRVVDIWPGQEVRDYWFLDHTQGSSLDMEKLYENEISKVHRWYGDDRNGFGHDETDLQYLKRFNW